jgi:hypothetical protein
MPRFSCEIVTTLLIMRKRLEIYAQEVFMNYDVVIGLLYVDIKK